MVFSDLTPEKKLLAAVAYNHLERTKILLESGITLKTFEPFSFSATIDLEIVELLNKYDALPEGMTLKSVKSDLLCAGHPWIGVDDFTSEELSALIQAKLGDPNAVRKLIEAGVTDRPLDLLPLAQDVPVFDRNASDKISAIRSYRHKCLQMLGRLPDIAPRNGGNKAAQVAALFLSNPNKQLTEAVDKMLESPKTAKKAATFLFWWAAARNKADLLERPYLQRIFEKADKQPASLAIIAFGSEEFAGRAIQKELLNVEDIQVLISLIRHTPQKKETPWTESVGMPKAAIARA